jgi:integrase/recombinase XerC
MYNIQQLQTITEASGGAQIAQPYIIIQDLLDKFTSFIDSKPKTIETYYRAIKQFIKYLQNNGIKQPCRMDVVLALFILLRLDCFLNRLQAKRRILT